MFLAILTMLTALTISGVAIYYSVAGLAAIFAAAVIPIIIMGGVLEIAKLVTAVWLHRYWSRAVWWLKAYLSTAVLVLMLITSMGIFGFLSKAHIEQTALSTEQGAQIENLEEKLIRSQSKIDRWDTELSRLLKGEDVRVDNLVSREQEEIDKLYERLEEEKATARADADAKIQLQNNRLAQAQQRKEQDIQIAQDRYPGPFADKNKLDKVIERATNNELSVASAVQRQIVSINAGLAEQIETIDLRYAPQISQLQERINSLRDQSNTKTQDIDSRINELEALIASEQTDVASIREDKAVIEREYRKLEAEVGPVKYIAEFIYGEEADKNLLEEAVRWVIIVIIFVFDPLAVLLLIASQYTFQWRNEDYGNIIDTPEPANPEPTTDNDTGTTSSEGSSEDTTENRGTTDSDLHIQQQRATGELDNSQPIDQPSAVDDAALAIVESYAKKKDITVEEFQEQRTKDYAEKELSQNFQQAKKVWKELHPNETLKEYKTKYIRGQIDELPWEADNTYVQNAEQGNNSIWQRIKKDQE